MALKERAKVLIRSHEGVRERVYPDSLGVPTVGIGMDLRRPGAALVLGRVGVDYLAVLNGQVGLSLDQIEQIFDGDVDDAISVAARVFGAGWDGFPENAQLAFTDMAFQLGPSRLAGFHNVIAAATAGNWSEVAQQMLDSEWAREQTPERAKEDAELVQTQAS